MSTGNAVLVAAAREVANVLAATTDWEVSGYRDGQYRVDLAADAACLAVLHQAGYRTLSEESGITEPDRVSAPGIVVVDPLDGSTNASRGIGWYGSSLCLVDDDGPRSAVVVNHVTGQRFTAERGVGAWCDGRSIAPSEVTALADAIVGVSGLPAHHYGWAQYRALGAAALDLCHVADGGVDAWCDIDDAHGVWDYLASVLIVQEAGGMVGDVFERDLVVLDPDARRAPIAAATPELFAELGHQRRQAVSSA